MIEEHFPGWPKNLTPNARKALEAKIRELLDDPIPTAARVEKIEKLWRLMTDQEKTPKPRLSGHREQHRKSRPIGD